MWRRKRIRARTDCTDVPNPFCETDGIWLLSDRVWKNIYHKNNGKTSLELLTNRRFGFCQFLTEITFRDNLPLKILRKQKLHELLPEKSSIYWKRSWNGFSSQTLVIKSMIIFCEVHVKSCICKLQKVSLHQKGNIWIIRYSIPRRNFENIFVLIFLYCGKLK